MTLGIWFKDYVYMPLVVSPRLIRLSGKLRDRFGKRVGKNCMTVVPLCVVWFLTGLWHSTGWNYIVWGSDWASLIILSTIFEPEITRLSGLFHIPVHSRGFQAVRMLRLFMLVIVSRILTEPGSLAASAEILKKIVFQFYPWELFDGTLYILGLDRPGLHLVTISLCMLGIIGWKQEKGIVFRDKIAGLPIVLRWSVLLAGIAAVLVSSNLFAVVVGFGKNICYNIYDGYAWQNYGCKGVPDWIVDPKYFFDKVKAGIYEDLENDFSGIYLETGV